MTTCVKCRQDVGFLGMLSLNRQTGRCGKCESEVKQALMRFRVAFVNFCSDGKLTPEKWKALLTAAAHDQLNIQEALVFIREDALNLLNRILTFADSDGYIKEEDEQNIRYIGQTLAIPVADMQPILNRLDRLKYITNIRRGNLPQVMPSIRLDTDEFCHIEIPATYHKVNSKSVSYVQGRFVITNKKLRFLSPTGGTEISWNSVMRVQKYPNGIYLELSRKSGNGFYAVSDSLLTEAVIDTLARIAKRQLVGERSTGDSRRIPQEVRAAVWQRDQGKCVQCGAHDYLEFDHIIPYSKGGASTVNNVQLLCRRCNLQKSDRI
jgi:HNH endonuclease